MLGKRTKQFSEGCGGFSVPESKNRPCTSVIPTEEAGLKNKSFIQAQKQSQKHDF